MKTILKSFLFVLLISSCAQVYFVDPLPQKGLVIKSFIDEVQGVYGDSLLEVEVLKNELIVGGDRYQLCSKSPGEKEVLVKFYNDFYFANFKDSSFYSVFMGKFYENKLAIYMLNADAHSINRLKKMVTVQTLDSTKQSYLIQPTKKQFDQMVNSELFDVVNVMDKRD
ncbi:MAG: hypothetical protein ACERKD_13720 [Prolixibacteraceae bacterium]